MIEIVGNDNRHVAEADGLENAIGALRTLVLEEEEDLRAVGEDGIVLAVGFYGHEFETCRVVTVQGQQRKLVHPRPFAPTRLDERD